MRLTTYHFKSDIIFPLIFLKNKGMSTVKRIAEEVAQELNQILLDLNKPVVRKLSFAVGAMIEGQTPNTVELSNLLPLDTEFRIMQCRVGY